MNHRVGRTDWIASACGVAVLLLFGGAMATGQSTLPPTTPTTAASSGQAVVAQVVATPAVSAMHAASVVYAKGKLEVSADNSSLNQILREIARQSGMKITGGVTDERVFGKYGPAALANVLENLLGGTGSNMLLRENATMDPAELILTPREGGPTPPNPNAAGFDDDAASAGQAFSEAPPVRQQVPRPGAPGGVDSQAPGADGSPQDNATKTPQQIYQRLQQLREGTADPKPQ